MTNKIIVVMSVLLSFLFANASVYATPQDEEGVATPKVVTSLIMLANMGKRVEFGQLAWQSRSRPMSLTILSKQPVPKVQISIQDTSDHGQLDIAYQVIRELYKFRIAAKKGVIKGSGLRRERLGGILIDIACDSCREVVVPEATWEEAGEFMSDYVFICLPDGMSADEAKEAIYRVLENLETLEHG